MMKSLAAATTLAILLAGAAFAQAPAATPAPSETPAATETVPTTPEACIDAAAALGQTAEGKTFSEATVEKLDKLFTDMEQLCDGKKFDEAMAVAKDIKTTMDGN